MSELTASAVVAMERTPQKIGEEIRTLTYQAKCMTVYYGVEIGRRLVEAKKMVGHGAWGEWVKNETEFSQSTATRFMKVFEEYGADQIGIFGAVENSSTLQNISISNALRLLAVPKDEREEFAAEVDAEHISARELERVIQERDEAWKRAEGLQRDLDAKQSELNEAEQTADALLEELDELKNRPVEVAVQVDEGAVSRAAEEARAAAAKEWGAKLKEAEKKALTAEKERSSLEKQVKKLQKDAEAAENSSEDAERLAGEVERLKKQLAMSDAGIAAFKAKFEGLQAAFATVRSAMGALEPEARKKMEAALRTQLDAWSSLFASE